MPELPEVETTRRHLVPLVVGRTVVGVEIAGRTARRNSGPADVVSRLTGRTVRSVGRRGKFLLAPLDSGDTWVVHLGMSGRIRTAGTGEPRELHTRFVAVLDDGAEVRLVDPRTFGFVAVLDPDELARALRAIGPDALDELPSAAALGGRLAGRRAPVKALLLDQRIVSGLGNIYADEVLHRAGIHPLRSAGSLRPGELEALREAITSVLAEGIAAGGTSLDDLAYLLPDGRAGAFGARLAVYGRDGQPCRSCGTAVERVVVSGRSSHYCPRCQPPRRERAKAS